MRRWPSIRHWPPVRRWAALGVAVALAAGLTFAMADGGQPQMFPGGTGTPAVFNIAARPLVQRLSLVGTVAPGSVVNMTGPFDGAVKEKLVEYGARVERGQAMLVLDTTEIELLMREAEAGTIKAGRTMEDLKTWGNTPEVVRARNGVLAAQMKVDELNRKEKENKALLVRGIIPRIEYDSVTEQLKAQELQLTAARQDLHAILERANAENRRLASLELETAQKRLAELKRQMDAGLVEAPVSGLVLRPPASSGANEPAPAVIEVGSRIGKGQPMFSIADTETLNVVARVDEIDVNRITEGQSVEVTGDAFGSAPLLGRVARLSVQAASNGGSSSSRSAAFDVVVTVPALTEEQRRRIRIGMSAALSIATYENPAAIVVPAEAVRMGGEGAFAVVLDPASGTERNMPVMVGRSTEEGVEILEGLKEGDAVLVGPPAINAINAMDPMRAPGPQMSLK